MQERILIVDDDPVVLEVLTAVLAREGFAVTQAVSGPEGLDALGRVPHALALCDIRMPGMDGFELLGKIRRRHPEVDVVLTTGYGSLEGAVDALAQGAVDYLTKPLKPREIVARLRAILERRRLQARVSELQRELHRRHDLRNLVAESDRMRALATALERVAAADDPVLLRGEPGTGRRLVARAIHYSGERRERGFDAVECDSPPREGLELYLFGHFQEGRRPRRGQLERLAGGTLHLHRLEHLPPKLQQRLAHAIVAGEVRTGPSSSARITTRLVLSCADGLETLLAEGRLVPELVCLRDVTALDLPPLAERGADLPGLLEVFCERHAIDHGRRMEVTPEAQEHLAGTPLSGNVAELFRVLGHAATLSLDSRLTPDTIERALRRSRAAEGPRRPIAADLGDREYQLVLRAVQRNPGRLDEAARELGVSRTTLWRRMRKYDIKV